MSQTAEINFHWAAALLDGLAQSGVRRVVVSPGSRSTPLTLAAMRHGGLAVSIVLDERSAAFHALGLAKADENPVAVIATSGSAIANWYPAVVEADMAQVPLVLLSADRPPELQNCGANQTMDQGALFGTHVRAFHHLPPAESETGWLGKFAARAVAASRGPMAGPVHVNVPLREPLTPKGAVNTSAQTVPQHLPANAGADARSIRVVEGLLRGKGVIMCGPRNLGAPFHGAVAELARRLRVPVFADVLSGLRFGSAAGTEVLAHPDQVSRHAASFDWALRFGGTPVCRAPSDWLERCRGVPQIVVSDSSRYADPAGNATHLLTADGAALCRALAGVPAPAGWLERFLAADRVAATAAGAACDNAQAFEGTVLRRLSKALPAGTPLFIGNSLAIRAAEWFAGRTDRDIPVFGNRGLSGIDGNLSTAFGIAAARGATVAVTGDLSFLHDLNALSLGRSLPLTIVLMDNGGGGIFDHLPQAALPEFEEGWITPAAFDPAAVAQGFGLSYVKAAGAPAAVEEALRGLSRRGSTVVHVPIDRRFSVERCRSFFATRTEGNTP